MKARLFFLRPGSLSIPCTRCGAPVAYQESVIGYCRNCGLGHMLQDSPKPGVVIPLRRV